MICRNYFKRDLIMKNYFFLISLFLLISCGKNSENNKNNNTKNQNPVVIETMELAGKEYTEHTINGASIIKFYESEGGEITVFLDYGGAYSPLEEYNENSLKVVFRFDDFRQIEDDIIELSKIQLTSNVFVRNCSLCNRGESYRHTIESIEKFHYDILQDRETIKVRIIKDLKKNQFYMLNFGKHVF